MSDFIFKSPGAKFIEKDLTFRSPTPGLTTLGMVGETQKGPAFTPIFISNKSDFYSYFGSQSNEKLGGNYKYLLPYYANAYLTESNQLYVTRVLGLNGYNAGTGWAITVSAGIDKSTTGVTGSNNFSGVSFSNNTFSGITITSTGTYYGDPIYVKNGTQFTGTILTLNVTSLDSTVGSGVTSYNAITFTGSSLSAYENMVVAVIRSRGSYVNNVQTFDTTSLSFGDISSATDITGDFNLSAGTEVYTCSLSSNKTNFISNVLGKNEKDKNAHIFVESVYPDLIKYLNNNDSIYGVNSTLVTLSGSVFTNYNSQYTAAETPYVVSEVRGNKIYRLFKFITLSDGDTANKQIKISLQRIDPDGKKFDVIIRDFNDTDDKPLILETFTNVTMDATLTSFIGKRIGGIAGDLEFPLISKYVSIEMPNEFPQDAFPCGFEGYMVRNYSADNTGSSAAVAPLINYKTSYAGTDRVARTYLGVSERAYDTTSIGTGINQNIFNFNGASVNASSFTKTNGFHLDSGATGTYTEGTDVIGTFITGAGDFKTSLDIVGGKTYNDVRTRKFTLVPAGGFDGWDIYRDYRTNNGQYVVGKSQYVTGNDYDAYLAGIRKFENPEETQMNIFATPGLNFYDHTDLINETIDMIERDRGDAVYIIDAPDMVEGETEQDLADKLDVADIDSNYSATYGPHIQINDKDTGSYVWIPPTGEVARVMALTDKLKFPWFAPAGISRGVIPSAINVKRRLTEAQRDTLYEARINAIAKFSDSGIHVWGQKTLQKAESALDRINVRRLLNYAKKIIGGISKNLIFEQNDEVVISDFLGKVNPILANIQRERGLRKFEVKASGNTPESLDRNELYFEINLTPTSSLEFVGITFNLNKSTGTASFND